MLLVNLIDPAQYNTLQKLWNNLQKCRFAP